MNGTMRTVYVYTTGPTTGEVIYITDNGSTLEAEYADHSRARFTQEQMQVMIEEIQKLRDLERYERSWEPSAFDRRPQRIKRPVFQDKVMRWRARQLMHGQK